MLHSLSNGSKCTFVCQIHSLVFCLTPSYTNQDMVDAYKKAASALIALKSVSADPAYKEDCVKTALWLKDKLSDMGCETKLIEGYGNPVVFGSFVADPSYETVLIYGHYDVQPASKEDGWESDPFTLSEKDGKFFGRGIMDDKCQVLIHILAIEKLITEKKLGYNVKFLFEGNEETGSPYIEQFIKDHKELLTTDFIFLSDGEMTRGKPTLELGNRGIVNWKITFKTANSDIHSGLYGGVAPNAIHELAKFLTKLLDENNRITIEGFYDAVDVIEKGYHIPFDLEEYKKNSGTKALFTEPEFDFFTQTGLRPAMTVTGMYGGYIQEGHKTSIPSQASAKINLRLVQSQDPKKIAELVKKHVEKHVPSHVSYEVSFDEFAGASKTDSKNPYVQKAKSILEAVFGQSAYYRYVGGTEPVILYFQQILGKPIVSVPFANEDGMMHGTNENFDIANIQKAFAFSAKFFGRS